MRYETEPTTTTENGWQEEWADWWQGYWSDAPAEPAAAPTPAATAPLPALAMTAREFDFAYATTGGRK
ncbi:MAG TPA: hypothetical protein VFW96_24600 [Thermomicrobiales bacterium]|nr:hypothetical protein [Thermomicrobiales bacterium]